MEFLAYISDSKKWDPTFENTSDFFYHDLTDFFRDAHLNIYIIYNPKCIKDNDKSIINK